MFGKIIDILKISGIGGAIIIAATIFGAVINQYIPWDGLTNFFIICRHLTMMFDFMVNIPLLWLYTGYAVIIAVSYIAFEVTIIVAGWFKN